ncbi:hypothetical protein [Pseudothermotoga sp.]|uniref:hypothetical protein n=1 Tax=Pseudothermotoga sp. TaxID=2033661 RepID=UPI0031F66613
MKSFDAYVRKQLLEKFPSMVFFFVISMLPEFSAKAFGFFFLVIFSIASDVRQKRLDLLLYLPLTRKRIFLFEYAFLTLLLFVSFFAGLPFASRTVETWVMLFKSLIFLWAYLGIVLSAVSVGMDPFGAAFLFLLFDLVVSSIGSSRLSANFNPYKLISPIRQDNTVLSAAFALFIIYASYKLFTQKGGEK